MAHPGWPARLSDGPVGLRPLRWRDAGAWVQVRRRNQEWLRPWEATPPGGGYKPADSVAVFVAMRRELHGAARRGLALPFVVTYDGELAGQVTVANIVRGSLHSAAVGYWVDERVAGRGVMPTALALTCDHCFRVVGLHRIEANIRPENAASRRVVEKLGFRDEGLRRRFLHIAGDWRDHLAFALTVDDLPDGVLRRYRRTSRHTGAGA